VGSNGFQGVVLMLHARSFSILKEDDAGGCQRANRPILSRLSFDPAAASPQINVKREKERAVKLAITLSVAMLAITQVAAFAEYRGAPPAPATDPAAANRSATKGKIEKSAKKGATHLQKDARPAQPSSQSASPW
jgi:hypothetical protein